MSIFGAEFLRDAHQELKCGDGIINNYNITYLIEIKLITIKFSNLDDKVDLPINLDGHLFLASRETSNSLYESHKIQL